jgi:hypothetical protein
MGESLFLSFFVRLITLRHLVKYYSRYEVFYYKTFERGTKPLLQKMLSHRYKRANKNRIANSNCEQICTPIELIPVDDECEVAALLIHIWLSSQMKKEENPKREIRTANACYEHKSRHQKCPPDCLNRGNRHTICFLTLIKWVWRTPHQGDPKDRAKRMTQNLKTAMKNTGTKI